MICGDSMRLYQEIAKLYDLLYSYRDYRQEARFLVDIVRDKDRPRILDIACGTGVHLDAINKMMPGAYLEGIDLNRSMLEVASSKSLGARLTQADMRDFGLGRNFDLVYCLSSSIQYNLTQEDLLMAIDSMRRHAVGGKVVFDLAFCMERWKEGHTNITANSDDRYDVAELYTTHSRDGISIWNPVYLVKDKRTGRMDMHVDEHRIKLWGIAEMESLLASQYLPYSVRKGFSENGDGNEVPVFIIEGFITGSDFAPV
jgi:SAM-dependent methyltransferase